MNPATPDHYQRLINLGHSSLADVETHWETIPTERIPVARFGQGLDALNVAIGYLMLAQVGEARSWFRTSAHYFLEAGRPPDTVISEKRALECALFSGDQEFRIQVAQKIPVRETRTKPMDYSYLMFLKYMILNERTEASAFADETAWLSRATLKKRGGYGTLQETCKAFACGQSDAFTMALEKLLDEHKMKAAHGNTRLPDGIVCFPAAALLILAREQGFPVHGTNPFVPAALLD